MDQKKYTKHCRWCGAEFVTTRKHTKWHSNACRQAAYRRRELSKWIITGGRDPIRPPDPLEIAQKGQIGADQKKDDWPAWAGRRPDEYSPTREFHKF